MDDWHRLGRRRGRSMASQLEGPEKLSTSQSGADDHAPERYIDF
jgi:hypothetical protein